MVTIRASLKVRCPSKRYLQPWPRFVWLHRDAAVWAVSIPNQPSYWLPVPRTKRPSSCFRGLSVLLRVPSTFCFPVEHFRTQHYLPRVLSLIATSQRTVTKSSGLSKTRLTFRPQTFSVSRRFTPVPCFAGLFHPAATSRVFAVQGLLSPRDDSSSSEQSPPMLLVTQQLVGRNQPPSLRNLNFEVFIHAK
jgi:hypothetical protein